MAQVINTNSISLIAQNNLNKSQSALGTAIERLSSGMRINSAKDDAAGQAIANRFTANIRGLTQAARNANDGISLAQTTEGALNEINNNVQRIRELTVQALNGTNSKEDIGSIQKEINQRLQEINRVSEQTDFNGTKVLDKGITGLVIQVGANDGETIQIDLKSMDVDSLGLTGFTVGSANGSTTPPAAPASALLFDNTASDLSGLTAGDLARLDAISTGGALTATTTISGLNAGDELHVYTDDNGDDQLVIINSTAGTYTSATAAESSGVLTITPAVTANDLLLTFKPELAVPKALGGQGDSITDTADLARLAALVASAASTDTINGLTATQSLQIYNDGTGDQFVVYDSSDKSYTSATVARNGTSLDVTLSGTTGDLTATLSSAAGNAGTPDPLDTLDKALAQIDDLRSDLGAIQNRFESTIANLNNTVNNLSAARSRIEDADYATEVSNMSKNQILQQAGTSVLSQANQIPQVVLSLLR